MAPHTVEEGMKMSTGKHMQVWHGGAQFYLSITSTVLGGMATHSNNLLLHVLYLE